MAADEFLLTKFSHNFSSLWVIESDVKGMRAKIFGSHCVYQFCCNFDDDDKDNDSENLKQ